MSELTPETKALLEETKEALNAADDPSQAELDKTLAAVTATIAAGGALAAGSAAAAVGTGAGAGGGIGAFVANMSLASKVVVGVATAITAGTLAVSQVRRADDTTKIRSEATLIESETSLAQEPMPDAQKEETDIAATDGIDESVGAMGVNDRDASKTSTSTPRKSKPIRVQDPLQLKAEFDLLRQAQAARGAGDSKQALHLLDAHKARFPRGALSAERMATRALTLCDIDKGRIAQRTARKFLRAYPRSPLARKVRKACLK